MPLTLGMNDIFLVSWLVDASYGIHPDMKSQTEGVASFGKRCSLLVLEKGKAQYNQFN